VPNRRKETVEPFSSDSDGKLNDRDGGMVHIQNNIAIKTPLVASLPTSEAKLDRCDGQGACNGVCLLDKELFAFGRTRGREASSRAAGLLKPVRAISVRGHRRLAGELGFEPRQTESESVVLPLHHSPIIAQRHQYVRRHLGKCARAGSGNPADWRPSTRYLPPLASARG
jgi:hypothetical protein